MRVAAGHGKAAASPSACSPGLRKPRNSNAVAGLGGQYPRNSNNVRGRLALEGAEVGGYEIHAGVTSGVALERPAVMLEDGRSDGAISADGQIIGTYLHGLFESPAACAALLRWAGVGELQEMDYRALRERDIERLADQVAEHLDTARLKALCGLR